MRLHVRFDHMQPLGGDEFAVVLPNTHYPDGAEITAHRLLERIAQPMQIDGRSITVTMSIGVSAFPRDGQDATHLLKHADTAMYRAKRAGRNGYAIYDETKD